MECLECGEETIEYNGAYPMMCPQCLYKELEEEE